MALCAAGLLAFAGAASAQPPGITPEMINTTLPLEGAPLAVPGPYQVTSGAAFGAAGLMVFHPATLDAFPARDTLPVLVWGNGGCGINTARYSDFLSTIASHGFLILGTAQNDATVGQFDNFEEGSGHNIDLLAGCQCNSPDLPALVQRGP
jgi:hypothetical protein